MGIPPVGDPGIEVAAIISSETTQPLEGASLRILYLVESASCKLVSEDTSQVSMDPSPFMLAPLLMTDSKYELWRNGIPHV